MAKGLSADAKKRLADALVRVRNTYPEQMQRSGWQSDLADRLGVDQGTISRASRGEAGSAELIQKVAEVIGEDPTEILYGVSSEDAVPPLRSLNGYKKCLAAAKERASLEHLDIPQWIWDAVGNFRGRPAVRIVTPGYVYELAVLRFREARSSSSSDAQQN